MKNRQMISNDDLEEQRRFYQKKFESLNWIPLPDEQIVQANAPYPCYWYVSSRGYVLSVYGKEPQKLKPALNWCGSKNKKGKRTRKEYLLGYYTDESGEKEFHCVRLHKIMSEHFPRTYVPEGCEEKPSHTHHCKPISSFAPEQFEEANRAKNLRKTVECVHNQFTKAERQTLEENMQQLDKLAKGVPVAHASQEFFFGFLRNLLGDNPTPEVIMEKYPNNDPQSKPIATDGGTDIGFILREDFENKDTDEQQEGGEEQ